MAIPVRRRAADVVAFVFASMATAFGLFWLFWILWTTLAQGAAALTPALFTQMTPPPGASGGLINAFYGSAVMIMLALVVGTPLGIAAGTYLAEHGRYTRLAALVSFINDILLSAPSIVIGLFIYEIVVRSMGHFSGFAGALTSTSVSLSIGPPLSAPSLTSRAVSLRPIMPAAPIIRMCIVPANFGVS